MTTGSPGADSSNLVTRLIDGKPMVVLGMKGKQLSIFCAYVLVLSGCDGSSKTSEATLGAIFGNSVGADESARNDTTVILNQAAVDKMDCRTLVPVVGKAMQAVLSGH